MRSEVTLLPPTGAVRPHAVSSLKNSQCAITASYTYDANGNMTGGDGREFTYSVFDQMTKVTRGTSKLPTGDIEIRRRFGGEVVAIHPVDANGNILDTKRRFQMLDHLGSPIAVYDGNADMKERLSFGSWGNRRDFATLTALPPYNTDFTSVTTRGYTGHEHGDAFGIIHMNGRIYDPTLGRMLQADPFIQAPGNTQSYNRYSYVLNNPLVYTDPSGYNFFRKVVGAISNGIFGEALASQFPIFRPILQLAACASGNPIICAGSAFGNAYAAGGSINDSLKSGGFAYLSANAFNYIGGQFMGEPGTALARGGFLHGASHAVTGGVLSELQGGKFGHGFISAGVSFGTGHLSEGARWSKEAQFTATVIAGGTVSEITGGKFANGATTAAFAFIFNQSAHPAQEACGRYARQCYFENMSSEQQNSVRTSAMQGLNTAAGVVADAAVGTTLVCPACVPVTGPVAAGATVIELATDMALTNWNDVFETTGVEAFGMGVNTVLNRSPILRNLPSQLHLQIRAAPETIYNLIDNAQEFSGQ